jgi:hypothetical protein
MIYQARDQSPAIDVRVGLAGVVEALCYLPREDAYCALLLALMCATVSAQDAIYLVQRACEASRLPVGQRWEIGQRLVQRLAGLVGK